MTDYFLYALTVLVGFIAWIAVFFFMNKSKDKSKNTIGAILLGPAYFILKRRGYRLTRREIFGWIVVFIFMLLAPAISYWLEK
ncbi:hypothetical protein [Massilia antarctica]|uniref:hypothetical protein n=1 Tax=Massilia antarctica TaxID=2765360 RepID=UPI0022717C11|nr:hypothetical protein [Massilia sp. H27-R4]MCY0915975.1 hypothetical protein [Massilia sp. H27-R4]